MKRLQAITGVAAMLLLAGCAAAGQQASQDAATQGTVTGRFLREGGPLGPGGQQPAERPIQGTIQFTAAGHQLITVRVGSSGTFSVSLPAGTYQVAGRSPRIIEVSSDGTQHETPCSQPLSVTVTARHTTKIAVTCIVP
jgi:hypothetical protein